MITVILSLAISTGLCAKSVDLGSQTATTRIAPVHLIAAYDPNDDPGKDLTPDPHDEIHDKDLPANNPDDYLSNETYPPKSNDD
ncbi:MAG: hypothetical protein SGJ27_08295 [Candidatus Melainabacteria bacterium]|nr:hypothetical protein [Candidatus Melainabacteria bacterium]